MISWRDYALVVARRGKIVCTLGPATSSDESVKALVEAGMDVARLNFSHGDYSDHKASYDRVRAVKRWLATGDPAVPRRYGATWAVRRGHLYPLLGP